MSTASGPPSDPARASLLQRARDHLLRPARQELAQARAEIEQLRRDLAALGESVLEARRIADPLRQAIVAQQHELSDRRRELDAHREELSRVREALDAQQRALDAQLQARDAQQQALEQARRDLAAQGAEVEESSRANRQLRLDLSLQAASTQAIARRLSDIEVLAQESRIRLLEQLLADSGPPGRRLPSPGPLVSIVMPTRNRAASVAEAIASVQAQDYPDWELHIVDDGGWDDTAAVIAPFLADPRVHYEAISHSGPSVARNHALRVARGEFVAYLDSDNLWFPGFLRAAVSAFAGEPGTDLVYGVLATDAHFGGGLRLLFEAFDRARLEHANYIDLNVVVHRRSLCEAHGLFDEKLTRLVDWDLLLRYTAHAPARALPVLAASYRVCDEQRVSQTVPVGPNWLAVRNRVDPPPELSPAPRILYVMWHYPQLSESYIESELLCLRRWGVEIAVWREVGAASPYESQVPVYDGDLATAVRDFRPDALHVHWLGFALGRAAELDALGLPVTLRMHGFDTHEAPFRALLGHDWLHRAYAYPHHLRLLESPDARVTALPAAFESRLFPPAAEKDPGLVLRTAAGLPSKDLALFMEVAKRLPSHRFVLCCVTCNGWEHYPEELRRMAASMGSPVELRFDVPRGQIAALMARAGIYLHTANPPDVPPGTPIGMPISIAEAMATGAHVLVRDVPELAAYVGDVGAVYRDAAHAAELIEATSGWSEAEWLHQRIRASDRAFLHFADETVLRPMLADWQALARERQAGAGAQEAVRAA